MTAIIHPSIKSRFVTNFIASLLKAGLTFVTGLLIARDLGPAEFGSFSFLLASFVSIRSLFDMGTSYAFFTFISKKKRSQNFYKYYFGWLFIQFIIPVLFILLIAPEAWLQSIWQGESVNRIILSFIAVFFQQHIWNTIAQVGESIRHTLRVQLMNVSVAVVHFSLILSLIFIEKLSVELIFFIIICEYIVVLLTSIKILPVVFTTQQEHFNFILKDYVKFCAPLVPYTIIGMLMTFADTWFLQKFGGSVQQAYFSVGQQFASISLIATTSILRIIWKELSEANGENNKERLKYLYARTSKSLFFITAGISGLLLPWTEDIILLTIGADYIGARIVLMIMFLYPVHQAFNLVLITVMMSLEFTKQLSIIASSSSLLGFFILYYLLAPNNAIIPGLGLGALGLALKMIITQYFYVNVSMFWVCRKLTWSTAFIYQLLVLPLMIGLGFFVSEFTNLILPHETLFQYKFIMTGVIWMFFLLGLVLLYPSFLAMKRHEITALIKSCIPRQFTRN